jgi:hypothetical protein
MKLPGLPLNLEGIGGFLLRHGEKLLGILALLGAALLAWSGIDALRGKGVREEQLPSAIEREAERADTHVGRVKRAPAEFLAAHDPLSDRLDAWRAPLPPWRAVAALELADPPQVSLLDKPIFQELAKRTKPDVVPVEELHAAAGVALVATRARAGGREGDQVPAGPTAKLAPYVIVTGLLPVQKQQDEYRGRFQSVGYKDAKRDSPLWSDFELERTVVLPGTADKWEPIDLAAAARALARDWGALEAAQPPPGWLFEQTPPVPFFGALPQRVDGGWGLDALHPRLLELEASRPEPGVGQASDARPEPEPAAGGPGFGDLPTDPKPAEERPEQPVAAGSPFRLIRFIDMGVETDLQVSRAAESMEPESRPRAAARGRPRADERPETRLASERGFERRRGARHDSHPRRHAAEGRCEAAQAQARNLRDARARPHCRQRRLLPTGRVR